ncbi:FadR/GntR family transcriptional regulator [Arthrobacter sp. FW306-2-2C-D06B]|uniref:FadR/GntR family transcriptional regulator n=1 Tax=Arthrobacter sp. FW306-2-2C-D06B TaxID=2879618 RepID=UPI001F3DD09D|nr:FCD domain-containing protein [Arthrobacter sp. FW306-2-2C-D06B]UKA60428.1 FCD domain-containing protein [Arthrobacter sp. FW306-2-2C-D06B]
MSGERTVPDVKMDSRGLAVRQVVFAPLGGDPLAQHVVRSLAEGIGLGVMRPGDRLPTESQLAQSLGVSLVVVREALSILRETGHVKTVRGKGGGTFVDRAPTPPSKDEARRAISVFAPEIVTDFTEFRTAIESEASALAAARAGARELEYIAALASEMRDTVEFHRYRELDAAFHMAIASASGSTRLAEAEAKIQVELGAAFNALIELLPEMQLTAVTRTSDTEHGEISKALGERNPEAARAAACSHVRGVRDLLIAVAGRLPRAEA